MVIGYRRAHRVPCTSVEHVLSVDRSQNERDYRKSHAGRPRDRTPHLRTWHGGRSGGPTRARLPRVRVLDRVCVPCRRQGLWLRRPGADHEGALRLRRPRISSRGHGALVGNRLRTGLSDGRASTRVVTRAGYGHQVPELMATSTVIGVWHR